MEGDRPPRWLRFRSCVLNNLLTILLVGSIAAGIIAGIIIRAQVGAISETTTQYIAAPGVLLIRMLKCSATPLIMSCIIVALGYLDLSVSKTIYWQIMVFIFCSKFLSAVIGCIAVLIIRPGSQSGDPDIDEESEEKQGVIYDIFMDMFRNILPSNMVLVYMQHYQTDVIKPSDNTSESSTVELWPVHVGYVAGMNVLGMVFIASVIGLTISILGEKGRGLLDVCANVYGVSMHIATWILWISPPCLFFLILAEILKIEDVAMFMQTWGFFILTFHLACLVIIVVAFPIILLLFARLNAFKLYVAIMPALVTAYATASSIGAMPFLIDSLEKKYGVDKRIVRFVVPVSVNLNKDGSCAGIVVYTIFMAQMLNTSLSWGHYVSIIFLAVFGSVATPSVPFSLIVVVVMVLNGLSLSQNYIAGIIAVEWINDRAATLTNIVGNGVLPVLIMKWNKKLLDEHDSSSQL